MEISKIHQRIQQKSKPQIQVCGVSWYEESEWQKIKDTATDPDRFENSFHEWLAMAEGAVHNLTQTGQLLSQVLINTDAFIRRITLR